jgi:hypothetical protein
MKPRDTRPAWIVDTEEKDDTIEYEPVEINIDDSDYQRNNIVKDIADDIGH